MPPRRHSAMAALFFFEELAHRNRLL